MLGVDETAFPCTLSGPETLEGAHTVPYCVSLSRQAILE